MVAVAAGAHVGAADPGVLQTDPKTDRTTATATIARRAPVMVETVASCER
jgi:hypothetical protein